MAKLENNLPYFILRIADCSRIHCSKLEDGGWMHPDICQFSVNVRHPATWLTDSRKLD